MNAKECPRHVARLKTSSSRLSSALERESTKVNRNRLGNIAVKIDKVLRASIELNDPVLAGHVDELALGAVRELGELGGGSNEASLSDRSATEEIGNVARYVVSWDGGGAVGSGHVVVDAESDLGCWGWESGDARGESQDG